MPLVQPSQQFKKNLFFKCVITKSEFLLCTGAQLETALLDDADAAAQVLLGFLLKRGHRLPPPFPVALLSIEPVLFLRQVYM